MAEAILGILALVVAVAAYVAGVAVGKLSASKERGDDPERVHVSPDDFVGGSRHHTAGAS